MKTNNICEYVAKVIETTRLRPDDDIYALGRWWKYGELCKYLAKTGKKL
jgi:hypothetical protein